MENKTMTNYSIIQRGNPFQVVDNMPMRKTTDIDEDIGHIVRIGSMNDTTSYLDIGTLIQRDFKKALIVIRSFKSGELIAYDMNGTNSNTFHKPNDIEFQFSHKTNTWTITGGIDY